MGRRAPGGRTRGAYYCFSDVVKGLTLGSGERDWEFLCQLKEKLSLRERERVQAEDTLRQKALLRGGSL